jgi:hypothetical protein
MKPSQPLQNITTTKSKETEGMTQGSHALHHKNSDDTPTGDIITVQYSIQKCASVIDNTSVLIVLLRFLT